MDSRVIIGEWGLYYGQAFIHDKWKIVTFGCFTVGGAQYQLKKWEKKYNNSKYIVDIVNL